MVTLIRREFEVPAPLDVAWNYLAQVQRWPEWAGHIKEVRLTPDGPLTPDSVGVIHLRNVRAECSDLRLKRVNIVWIGNYQEMAAVERDFNAWEDLDTQCFSNRVELTTVKCVVVRYGDCVKVCIRHVPFQDL